MHEANQMDNDNQISRYDRIRGALEGVALFSKQSTIRTVTQLTGRSETFVIETGRHAEQGDYIFIEVIGENQSVTRVCLPPKAADAVASQREALTTRRRRIAGKRIAQERKDRGELPGFMKGKKGGAK
jgi:hypothetical protein